VWALNVDPGILVAHEKWPMQLQGLSPTKMRRIRTLALISYFRLPEQGMKEYEVLSRASAFAVRSVKNRGNQVGGNDDTTTFAFSAHVAAPYLFPKLFPEAQDWLQFVETKHVRCFIQVNGEDTAVLHPVENIDRHKTRDLAVGSVRNDIYSSLRDRDLDLEHFIIDPNLTVNEGDSLICDGYAVGDDTDGDKSDQNEDRRDLWKNAVKARFLCQTPHQLFVSTDEALPMGMCGCPVVAETPIDEHGWKAKEESDRIEESPSSFALGMVEGSVPVGTVCSGPLGAILKNHHAAVCVEPSEIHSLLTREEGKFERVG